MLYPFFKLSRSSFFSTLKRTHTSFKKSAAATKMSYKRNEDDRQNEDDDGDEEIGEHVNFHSD